MSTDRKISVDGREINLTVWVGEMPAALPDLSGEDWRDSANDSADNDIDSIYRFALADGRWLDVESTQGCPIAAQVLESSESIASHVREWYHDCDDAEWLSCWGLDPLLDEPADDWDGPCRVWCEPQYHAGTCGAPQPGFIREENSEAIREFATRAEAQAYIDEYYSAPSAYDGIKACNVLSHGQYAADKLTLVQAG